MTGEITLFAGPVVPSGWVACQGQLVNIADYPTLFGVIGTTYGGDGVTTFGIPNLQGNFALGTAASYPLGATGGAATVTLVPGNLPAHTHTINADDRSSSTGRPAGAIPGTSGSNIYSGGTANTTMAEGTIAPFDGGSAPFSIMPPYLALTFVIATGE